ncbi:hypothetical protein N868_09185 [Cellulomonas carbonis T26]|uniref:Uncharacterized protein n=1 Tax=Cellulomonas carbonis T26 TaxID=947969 RepID=A0A0A0BWD9_9CELL|nr:hypothetical protein N868_09185 [Cellulomonas carbonis T26]
MTTPATAAPAADATSEAAPGAPAVDAVGGPTALRAGALALWGVVGTLLGYGILQTAIKASALFS